MAQKRRRITKRKSHKTKAKKDFKRFIRRLLTFAVMVVALFIGERLGLITVDWDEVYDQGESIVKEYVYKIYRPMKPAIEPVSGDWYQLYFTTPRYPDTPSRRVNHIEQGLITAIDSAQKTLDISIYELDLDKVGDASVFPYLDPSETARIIHLFDKKAGLGST